MQATDHSRNADSPAHDRVTQLLVNVEHTLEQELATGTQPPRYTPDGVEELLGSHARRIHGKHNAAVHEDVRDALDLIGRPAAPETPATLQNRILGALSGTEAGA